MQKAWENFIHSPYYMRHKCSSALEVQEYRQKYTCLSSSAAMRVTAAAPLHETWKTSLPEPH